MLERPLEPMFRGLLRSWSGWVRPPSTMKDSAACTESTFFNKLCRMILLAVLCACNVNKER